MRVSLQGYIFAVGVFLGVVILSLLGAGIAMAQQSSSTSYQVNEVFFGTGGELNACSTSYCSKQSAGETAVGTTGSTSYQAQAGFNTNREEYIELIVSASSTSLGSLTASTPATGTGTFSVKAYTASGYVVMNASDPPKNNYVTPYTLTALTTPTAYDVNAEQFGINLAANTSPATFGAAPVQIPDSSYSFGVAATGYNTANLYKYIKGDTIASSPKSSGTTNYTVSYLFKILGTTPAGSYTFNHDIVATATY